MWPFNQSNEQRYQQYAQAYDTGNFYGFDQNEAIGHLQQFAQNAPADMQQRVYEQHFSQMPYEQRQVFAQQLPRGYDADPNNPASLAQSLFRIGQEQPQHFERIFNHPILLGGAVVLTGLIAKHVLQHHHRYNDQGSYNQGGGYNQSYNQGGYNQGSYNQGGGYNQQEQYMQQEIGQLEREDRELRREIQEERREENWEGGGQRHHHHHREENW